ILKAFWNPAPLEERQAVYGRRLAQFELVDSPDAADIHLLPMKWQFYVEHDRVDEALRAVDVATKAKKPIAVFSLSDYVANFPSHAPGVHMFQLSGYRSRQRTGNHALPAFIDDPLAGGEVDVRAKSGRPVLGFCGQAGSSLPRHAARYIRTRMRQLNWRLGRERWEPAPLEHTWFRRKVLETFAKSTAVETRYVLRTKYRAGVRTDDRNDPAQAARREFLENVRDTDYTVCMRGGGNFSVRFYEALAMGRPPVFIDTDCVLPFHDEIDWRRYVIWIDHKDLARGPSLVAEAHASMSERELQERQRECRRLWEDRLTPDGFYGHFRELFPELR
ncbi:MAG: exostosin family protein, partial [Deltaproteobacteria bacterium]|nr:exostosin family protein [Deltaproteobacteria bacterium]